jgi:hypothetical protein
VDGSKDNLFTAVASVWQLLAIKLPSGVRSTPDGRSSCIVTLRSMFVVQTSPSSPLAVKYWVTFDGHYCSVVSWLMMAGGKETKQGYEATYDV